jgi:hypothetical protein
MIKTKEQSFSDMNKRSFLIDSAACAIFWIVAYVPIFLYTSRFLDLVLIGLGSAALVEVLLGGNYGRFLDWFRKRFSMRKEDSFLPKTL